MCYPGIPEPLSTHYPGVPKPLSLPHPGIPEPSSGLTLESLSCLRSSRRRSRLGLPPMEEGREETLLPGRSRPAATLPGRPGGARF